MLKLPSKVNNKFILVAPVLLGAYLAIMYPLHNVIFTVIFARFGVSFTNDYPLLTAFLLYVATIPLAVFFNRLLLKRPQSYDEKLVGGLAANVAFNITIALIFSFIGGSIVTLLVIPLVLSFFGFIIAALVIALIETIEEKFLSLKST
ncbi:hypothetical protein H7F15_03160 [Pontibacter sp. Tf4]|uniref:hypothetical protein n=1 Tax=Pontibacter sp. Tf4 TaxID=2761620 RepID=UPI001624AA11|nr:hypothetical protein [Pontibacter sp. Tf4]MBB6610025.1 hypothetical protein [Pontibacter sp. Tf4]